MNKKTYTKPNVTVHPIGEISVLTGSSLELSNQVGAKDVHAKEKSTDWNIGDDENYDQDGDPWN